jgi:hypothetical protein
MENPATHGPAEKTVRKVLDAWWALQPPLHAGLSLERQITDALREEGLLLEEPYRSPGQRPGHDGLTNIERDLGVKAP